MLDDLEQRRAAGFPPATSVFFGGGTPSLLPASDLARVLDAIDRTPGAEVTVECNPDSVDATKLQTYRTAGVNRLSFGVQSFSPHVLRALNRTHDPRSVVRAIEDARAAGFTRLSVDLIYGTPGETIDDWRRTLERRARARPRPHQRVRAHRRTGYAARPGRCRRHRTGSRRRRPGREVPDRRRACSPMRACSGTRSRTGPARVRSAGTTSATGPKVPTLRSVARPTVTPTASVGGTYARPSATSNGSRRTRRPEAGREVLDPETRRDEAFALALRTRHGAVPPAAATAEVEQLVMAGYLCPTADRVVLTRPGPVARQRHHGPGARRIGDAPRSALVARWHSIRLSARSPDPPDPISRDPVIDVAENDAGQAPQARGRHTRGRRRCGRNRTAREPRRPQGRGPAGHHRAVRRERSSRSDPRP